MNEIKLRAWDKSNKIMHYDFEFISSGNDYNDWIIFKSDKQKFEDGNVVNNPYFKKQFDIMRYIGFTDKNKVEIYENDRVWCQFGEQHNGHYEYNIEGVIKFTDGSFYIVDRDGIYHDFDYIPNECLEVYGNIYKDGGSNELQKEKI